MPVPVLFFVCCNLRQRLGKHKSPPTSAIVRNFRITSNYRIQNIWFSNRIKLEHCYNVPREKARFHWSQEMSHRQCISILLGAYVQFCQTRHKWKSALSESSLHLRALAQLEGNRPFLWHRHLMLEHLAGQYWRFIKHSTASPGNSFYKITCILWTDFPLSKLSRVSSRNGTIGHRKHRYLIRIFAPPPPIYVKDTSGMTFSIFIWCLHASTLGQTMWHLNCYNILHSTNNGINWVRAELTEMNKCGADSPQLHYTLYKYLWYWSGFICSSQVASMPVQTSQCCLRSHHSIAGWSHSRVVLKGQEVRLWAKTSLSTPW